MGRPPKVQTAEDGSVAVRTQIGGYTWRMVRQHAQRLGLRDTQALRVLMLYLDAQIRAGDTSFLPADWQQSAQIASNQSVLPPELSQIDPTLLHRSNKTKSGFVGVYANGKGFRAMGRRGEYIAQCDTALEAAWKRRLYYKQHNLSYGQMEEDIDLYRKRGEQGSDARLAEIVLETARLTNTLHLYTPEEIKWAEAKAAEAEFEGDDEPSRGELKMIGFEGGLAEAEAALAKLDRE